MAIAFSTVIYVYVIWRTTRPKFDFGWQKVGIAACAGLVLTVPPLIFFLFPVVVGRLDYSPIKMLPLVGLISRVGLEIPLLTALSEDSSAIPLYSPCGTWW